MCEFMCVFTSFIDCQKEVAIIGFCRVSGTFLTFNGVTIVMLITKLS